MPFVRSSPGNNKPAERNKAREETGSAAKTAARAETGSAAETTGGTTASAKTGSAA